MFVLVHMNTFARTLKISGFLHVSLSLVTKMKETQTSKKTKCRSQLHGEGSSFCKYLGELSLLTLVMVMM